MLRFPEGIPSPGPIDLKHFEGGHSVTVLGMCPGPGLDPIPTVTFIWNCMLGTAWLRSLVFDQLSPEQKSSSIDFFFKFCCIFVVM